VRLLLVATINRIDLPAGEVLTVVGPGVPKAFFRTTRFGARCPVSLVFRAFIILSRENRRGGMK